MDPNAYKHNLRNKLSKEQALQKLNAETFSRKTLSFYRYVKIENPYDFRDSLFVDWAALNCLGRIYVAGEGINAQMNVPEQHWSDFITSLNCYDILKDMPLKLAVEDDGKSFFKLTIKVRPQIVADGLPNDEYDVTNVGKHLNAEQWNQAIDQGAIVVDMRNHYESEIGHFENAIRPQSETFKQELPEVKDMLQGQEEKKVLLYCTGGIRCEKTSAYLKHHGFKDVNQLHGGIIDYARQLSENQALDNKFKGKNFVFDERLGERVGNEIISQCHQCGEPADTHVNCKNINCNLLFIQCSNCQEKHQQCCSPRCLDMYALPPEEQEKLRKGVEQKKRFHSHQKVDLSHAFKKKL
ncbi:MAG: rhodanese-related sulfurtransferase [Bacteroidota bacterium]|nr:rhodanese-related sulfurtransferase [Bacteroidota bacterium]